MGISHEDAMKMIDEVGGSAAPQASEPKAEEITPSQTSGDGENKNNDVNAKPAEVKEGEPLNDAGLEHASGADDAKASTGDKSKRTHQRRVDYSFKALKKQLAEKEKRITELEKKCELVEKLDKSDFSDERKYHENLMDIQLDKREIERLKGELSEDRNEVSANEFMSGVQEKANKLFTDEEHDYFDRLVEKGFGAFADVVNSHDPDGIVSDYLADSKNSPLLIRTLMTKPEILKRVLDCKLPQNKYNELRTLERNIEIRTNIAASKIKATAEKKNGLPVLGSMTKTAAKGEPTSYDDAWANEYLKSHKSGRF